MHLYCKETSSGGDDDDEDEARRRRRSGGGGGSEKPEVKACEGKEEGDKCSFGHGFLLLQHPGDGPHTHKGVCVDAGHRSLLQHPGEPGHKHLYCKETSSGGDDDDDEGGKRRRSGKGGGSEKPEVKACSSTLASQ